MIYSFPVQTTSQYAQETGLQSKESRKYIFRSLLDLAHVSIHQPIDNQEAILTSVDRMEFISLLSRMLTLDPIKRIRPMAALQMPFITMQHLAMHTQAPSVWEWIQCMQICHQFKPESSTPQSASMAAATSHGHTHNPYSLVTTTNGCCAHQLHMVPGHLMPVYPIIPHAHLVSLSLLSLL